MSCVANFNKAVEDVKKRRSEQEGETEQERALTNSKLRNKYYHIFSPENDEPLSSKMLSLRKLIIDCGLPPESDSEIASFSEVCSLRGMVWKVLLGAYHMDAKYYCDMVKLGPSSEDKKIRNDTFRTFKSNEEFWQRVNEGKMARVLNVVARMNVAASGHKPPESTHVEGTFLPHDRSGYVQGMNVLVAPFLYVMPELDAFTAFSSLITKHCPRYVVSNLDGAHHGCSLVDRVLEAVDPELHTHINDKICRTEIFAFQFIITLLANMLPLHEVIKVWDAVFAFGVHFDVVMVAAHVMLLRDKLLKEESSFRIQKMIVQEPLDAEILVAGAVQLMRFIPDHMFQELVSHPVEKPRDISQVLSREFQDVTFTMNPTDKSVVNLSAERPPPPSGARASSGSVSSATAVSRQGGPRRRGVSPGGRGGSAGMIRVATNTKSNRDKSGQQAGMTGGVGGRARSAEKPKGMVRRSGSPSIGAKSTGIAGVTRTSHVSAGAGAGAGQVSSGSLGTGGESNTTTTSNGIGVKRRPRSADLRCKPK